MVVRIRFTYLGGVRLASEVHRDQGLTLRHTREFPWFWMFCKTGTRGLRTFDVSAEREELGSQIEISVTHCLVEQGKLCSTSNVNSSTFFWHHNQVRSVSFLQPAYSICQTAVLFGVLDNTAS